MNAYAYHDWLDSMVQHAIREMDESPWHDTETLWALLHKNYPEATDEELADVLRRACP